MPEELTAAEREILDFMLLPLADEYEAGNRKFVMINPASAEEFEPFRECVANLEAQNAIKRSYPGRNTFQLTPGGYLQFISRIKALRALGQTQAD